MEIDDSKPKKVQVTLRMDPALHERLSDFVHDAGKGLPPKKQPSADAIIQGAVRGMLDEADRRVATPTASEGDESPKASKVGNTGQNTIVGSTSGDTPSTITPKVGSASDLSVMIPLHLRDWMDLVERAVTVQDATWVNMLSSIKHQLEIVAGHADGEKGSGFRGSAGSGRGAGTGGAGKGPSGPARGGNQKAG